MKSNFTLTQTIYTQKGKKKVWLEPGTYPIIRWFDKSRVLIDCTPRDRSPYLSSYPEREVTVISAKTGVITRED